MIMRDTIFCAVPPDTDRDAILQSVFAMERAVQEYVPGYRLLQEPQLDDPRPPPAASSRSRCSSRWRARATTCRRTPATSTS